MVSKCIGETEKNLAAAFVRGEQAGAGSLLDEAGARFGQRSEVKDAHDRDAHDRYANVDVGYLRQRIDALGGAVVVARNVLQVMDEAFTGAHGRRRFSAAGAP